MKTETNDADSDYIIHEKLQGRGKSTVHNGHRATGSVLLSEGGRDLSRYFGNLTESQYDSIYEKHSSDFEMFGYTIRNDGYVAKCEGKENGKLCC